MEKKYIFVCQMEESGQIFAGRKEDVDNEIRNFEEKEEDLPFTVIGKIEEPSFGLPLGFSERLIDWYDKEKMPDRDTIDAGVLAIVEIIR